MAPALWLRMQIAGIVRRRAGMGLFILTTWLALYGWDY